MKHYVVYSK